MRMIGLTNGKGFTLVSDKDYGWLSQWKWHLTGGKYASTTINGKPVYLHRLITNCPDNMDTDHKDGNGLNNQRGNLRVCTHRQNCMNAKQKPGKYKGVWFKDDIYRSKPWYGRIAMDGKLIHLGYFATAEECALAYNLAAKKYHGKFARLNVIPS